ncbi:MAG: M4 family metallopeptidase [Methylococcales bacterium]
MRLSVIIPIASMLATILNSAILLADPLQPTFQVTPLRGQIPSRFIQPSVVSNNNSDPEIKEIVNFLSTQKQQANAQLAPVNTQTLIKNASSTNKASQITQNTQSVLSNLAVRLTKAGTPRQVLPTRSVLMKRSSANQSSSATDETHTQTARYFLNTSQQLLQLDNPAQELTLKSSRTDTMGKQHLRFHQYYQNIPVWNCALTVHLNKSGDVELVDGAYFPSPKKLDTKPIYTSDQAIEKARQWIPLGENASLVNPPQLVIYPEQDKQPRLAWEIKLSAALDHHWLVLVDANTSSQILAYNQTNDAAATGSGQDVFGNQQQLNIFEDSNQFFMADTSKPMYQGGSPFPISEDKGAIYILDDKNQSPFSDEGNVEFPERLELTSSQNSNSGWPPAAVSAAFNLSASYDYYSAVHTRNSFDGNGGSIVAIVRVGNNYNNAFWNGQILAFGEAQPYAGALDIVGHELTHGIIDNTANLISLNQPGALNEAFSDIFGEAIEVHTFGQTDWVTGGQINTPFRSLRDPRSLTFRNGRPYPASMSEFVELPPTSEGDNGGVHINSTIISHAFYLLAEGLNGAIGINNAEQIFYRALVFHLVPRSTFIDTRLALIQSATEIYGESSVQALKTAEAMDAVEIFDAPPTPVDSEVTTINGPDATTFIRRDPTTGNFSLNRRDPALNDSETAIILSSFNVDQKRPSVARSKNVIAFINSDNDLCLVSSTNSTDESCLEQTRKFYSVAVSSDGEKFALVLRDAAGLPENQIVIIDISADGSTQTIDLVASATDNASTITISNADAMDFTSDGQMLIYDALNEISTADGSRIRTWSIYALDLIHQTTIALVPPVNGFTFAFPALSQTTDDYLTFDAFNENTGTNTVTTVSLVTGEKRTIDTSNNFGTPSFTGDDSAIVFSRPDSTTATGFSLFRQPLQTDRITPSGASELWLKDADYGVIYRRGDAITTPAPSQQTIANEGLWWIPSKPGSGFDIGITSNNDLYMVWYTYTLEGTPIWYLTSGPLNGSSWNADVIEYTWNGATAIPNSVGTATLNFQDNTHASLSWTLNTGNGSADIEYFVFDPGSINSSGTWFDQSQPGYGLTHVNQGSTSVNVLYFYDQAGNPRWALGSDASSQTPTIMNTFSGACPVCPFESSVATAAGTVTASFADQLNGTLSTDISLPSPLSGSWQIFGASISNLSE